MKKKRKKYIKSDWKFWEWLGDKKRKTRKYTKRNTKFWDRKKKEIDVDSEPESLILSILNIDAKDYKNCFSKMKNFKLDEDSIEIPFGIMFRRIIFKIYSEKILLSEYQYQRIVNILFVTFFKEVKSTTNELSDLTEVTQKYFNKCQELGLFGKNKDFGNTMINLLASEYLFFRYLQKRSLNKVFLKEISLIFNIKEKEQLRFIKAYALIKARKKLKSFITKELNLRGSLAENYIKVLKTKMPRMARILEDIRIVIGSNSLGDLILFYNGLDFELPSIYSVLGDKPIL